MTYTRIRWLIAGALFAATTINYIDRQTLSILSPLLRRELNLTERDYANIVTAFLIPYTVMYSLGGRLMDVIGVRFGLTLSLAWWSVATMLTGLSRGAFSLGFFRFLLGVGEPCVYPAGVKVCGEWFPQQLRATAVGIFSSGASIGAVLAPPLVAWLTLTFGWRYAFIIPGLLGLVWLPLWLAFYKPAQQHPSLTVEEKQLLARDEVRQQPKSWRSLLRHRVVWGLVFARFLSDPVWYFYLFWLPDYLQRIRGLSLAEMGLYGWIPFIFADLGSIGGGALSDFLVRRGFSSIKARLTVLIGVGCLAPVGALVGAIPSLPAAIAVTCFVALLTQCWSVNTASLTADIVPSSSTATVFGMMGTAGSLAGAGFAQVLGFVIGQFGYEAAFVVAAVLHPCAATILWLTLRRMKEPALDLNEKTS